MMNKYFTKEIDETLQVYTNDMIVMFGKMELYDQHLTRVFRRVWQYNMKFNLEKCTFEVRADKFLGFHLRN